MSFIDSGIFSDKRTRGFIDVCAESSYSDESGANSGSARQAEPCVGNESYYHRQFACSDPKTDRNTNPEFICYPAAVQPDGDCRAYAASAADFL